MDIAMVLSTALFYAHSANIWVGGVGVMTFVVCSLIYCKGKLCTVWSWSSLFKASGVQRCDTFWKQRICRCLFGSKSGECCICETFLPFPTNVTFTSVNSFWPWTARPCWWLAFSRLKQKQEKKPSETSVLNRHTWIQHSKTHGLLANVQRSFSTFNFAMPFLHGQVEGVLFSMLAGSSQRICNGKRLSLQDKPMLRHACLLKPQKGINQTFNPQCIMNQDLLGAKGSRI